MASQRVDNDTTRGVSLQCYDADRDQLTVSIDGPSHGTLGAVTTHKYDQPEYTYYSVTYTPEHGYVGPDSFSYKASDGTDESQAAEVSFDVTDPSPPTCAEPPALTMRPDHSAGFSLYSGPQSCNGSPGNMSPFLKFRITQQPEHGTLEDTDNSGNSGYVTYKPVDGYRGTDSFKYVATNGGGDSNEVTQQITLDPDYNRTPGCSSPGPPSMRVGGKVTVQLYCYDADGDPITFTVDSAGTRGTVGPLTDDPGPGNFGFPGWRYVTYTAPADVGDGQDSFSYTATDDRGTSSPTAGVQKFVVHPADYDTAPHCESYGPYGTSIESGTSGWISTQCSDDERDPLTYSIVTEPSHGTMAIREQGDSNGIKYYYFEYKPDAGYLGDDSFSYRATDDRDASSAPKEVKLTVVKPQPPGCFDPPLEKIRTGRERGITLYCWGGIFTGGGAPTGYAIASPPAHGTVSFPEGDKKGWVVYKPDPGYEGPDSFSYRSSNAAGDSNVVTQQISLSATFNRRPTCGGTYGNSAERVRSGSSRDLQLACWDPDGDPLTYKVTPPAHGSLGEVQQPPDDVRGFGIATVRYTPAPGFVGVDTFTVTAGDGIADSDTVKLSVNVADANANATPVCWGGTSFKVAANATYSVGALDFPCYDTDGDALTQQISTPPQHGTLSAPDSHGARTYTPSDPNWTGEDSFGFKAEDGRTTSGETTVRIEVTDPVQVTAEPVSLPSGEPVRIENYVDPGGKSLISVPSGEVRQFPGACMPLDVDTTIASGSGSVSDAKLVLAPEDGGAGEEFPMTHGSNDSWSAHIDCVKAGALSVKWNFTENGSTTALSKPLGGIVLIDPQGVVYDKDRYDAAVAAGKSPQDARAGAAIEGATVELQRFSSGEWKKVVSGDPGISPNVNPQTTKADGVFRWDVSAGKYRVAVTRPGYDPVTSAGVDIPPPVTTLNVAMTRSVVSDPGNSGNEGGGAGGGSPSGNDQSAGQGPSTSSPDSGPIADPPPYKTPKPACSGLKGTKKAQCESRQRLKQALAKCSKLKGKTARSLCAQRAKARAKCDPLKGRKKTACVRRANAIGTRKRR